MYSDIFHQNRLLGKSTPAQCPIGCYSALTHYQRYIERSKRSGSRIPRISGGQLLKSSGSRFASDATDLFLIDSMDGREYFLLAHCLGGWKGKSPLQSCNHQVIRLAFRRAYGSCARSRGRQNECHNSVEYTWQTGEPMH